MTHMQRDLLTWVVVPVAYSIGFFSWCYLAEKMPIFPKRNARSVPTILCGHVAVLLFLILLAQMAIDFYPSLPDWLKEDTMVDGITISEAIRYSVYGIFCIVSLIVGRIEKHWIYVDPDAGDSTSGSNPS